MANRQEEALALAEETLKNIELEEITVSSIVLKCKRLARLVNNENAMKLFDYEMTGYPLDASGKIEYNAAELAKHVNRWYSKRDASGKPQWFIMTETISELEVSKESIKERIASKSDAPTRWIPNPVAIIAQSLTEISAKIDKLKAGYYNFVLNTYYKLKFGEITEDIYTRTRKEVDSKLEKICPDALKKFLTIYDNLKSSEEENWANAVHSCRRVLSDLADSLYPPSDKEIEVKKQKVKLDNEHYMLRLKQYVKEKSTSETNSMVITSLLEDIWNRLDAVYKCTTKGTHSEVSKKEAERYVIYTYLIIGDLLSL